MNKCSARTICSSSSVLVLKSSFLKLFNSTSICCNSFFKVWSSSVVILCPFCTRTSCSKHIRIRKNKIFYRPSVSIAHNIQTMSSLSRMEALFFPGKAPAMRRREEKARQSQGLDDSGDGTFYHIRNNGPRPAICHTQWRIGHLVW